MKKKFNNGLAILLFAIYWFCLLSLFCCSMILIAIFVETFPFPVGGNSVSVYEEITVNHSGMFYRMAVANSIGVLGFGGCSFAIKSFYFKFLSESVKELKLPI